MPARTSTRPSQRQPLGSGPQWESRLAGFGLSWLALEFWLKRSGRGNRFARSRSVVLALIGIVSAGAYVNFGAWHFWSRIHSWDTFHYYVGAKYFRELSYEHLYECVAIADAEEAPLRAQVAKRAMRDLRTNVLGDTASILADPDRCKAHFSAARWFSFKKDVAYFRQALGSKRWEKAQTDHGFNGTPVWLLLGTGLASLGPATGTQISVLTWGGLCAARVWRCADRVGVRVAYGVRGNVRAGDGLSRPILLDRWILPTLGLAVLGASWRLLSEERVLAAWRVLPRVRESASGVPSVSVRRVGHAGGSGLSGTSSSAAD